MMNNKYLPVILVLMVVFVLALFADETLFEDINMSGYLKQGNGVTFLPATTSGNQTNNAILQFSNGTNTFSKRVLIGVNGPDSYNTSLGGPLYLNNTNSTSNTMIILDNTNQEAIISIGNHVTTHEVQIRERISPDEIWFRFRGTTSPTRFGHDGGVGFQFQPTEGTTVLDIENGATTNFTPFVGMVGITASNFQQRVGSAGGFVGNGSGLTNLPGTSVGGFTPGSVIFASSTGQLSQDNANFFWDSTNRRFGLGTATPGSQFHQVVTNGVQNFFMQDAYSSTATDSPDLIMRRARGTVAVPTAVLSNDLLGVISSRAYDGSAFTTSGRARIRFEAAQDWSGSANGSRMTFWTTPVGSTAVAQVGAFFNDGSFGVGTNAPISGFKMAVAGSAGFYGGNAAITPIDGQNNIIINGSTNGGVGYIQTLGGRASTRTVTSTNYVLGIGDYYLIVTNNNATTTVTLPAATALPNGGTFQISNDGTNATVNIVRAGTDTLFPSGVTNQIVTTTAPTITQGKILRTIIGDGVSGWSAYGN